MSTDENVAIARTFHEAWTEGNMARFEITNVLASSEWVGVELID